MTRVEAQVCRLVPQRLRRHGLQRPVQRRGRAIADGTAGPLRRLVQFVQHDHRVGDLAQHDEPEQLSRLRVRPVLVAARQRRHRLRALECVDELRHPQGIGQPGREQRLAQPRHADQQHRCDAQRTARDLRERAAGPHLLDRRREVRHFLGQAFHLLLPSPAEHHGAQPTTLQQRCGHLPIGLGIVLVFALAQQFDLDVVAHECFSGERLDADTWHPLGRFG